MHGKNIEGLTKDKDGLTVQYEAQAWAKAPRMLCQRHWAAAYAAAPQQAAAAGMQPRAVAEPQQHQQLLLEQMQVQPGQTRCATVAAAATGTAA